MSPNQSGQVQLRIQKMAVPALLTNLVLVYIGYNHCPVCVPSCHPRATGLLSPCAGKCRLLSWLWQVCRQLLYWEWKIPVNLGIQSPEKVMRQKQSMPVHLPVCLSFHMSSIIQQNTSSATKLDILMGVKGVVFVYNEVWYYAQFFSAVWEIPLLKVSGYSWAQLCCRMVVGFKIIIQSSCSNVWCVQHRSW